MDCSLPAFCPWYTSGKNTRVGCHFLLQEIVPNQESNPHLLHWQASHYHWTTWGVQFKWSQSCSVASNSLQPLGPHSPWNSPGQNTGGDSLSLLQGIFPTQGLNPGLSHCRRILYQLSHKGSPRILEWVACPFSSRYSQSRNQTGVSYIAGRFFTSWAMREAHHH